MPSPIDPRLVADMAAALATAICPLCQQRWDEKRHPYAPPMECEWCIERDKSIIQARRWLGARVR